MLLLVTLCLKLSGNFWKAEVLLRILKIQEINNPEKKGKLWLNGAFKMRIEINQIKHKNKLFVINIRKLKVWTRKLGEITLYWSTKYYKDYALPTEKNIKPPQLKSIAYSV